MAKEIGGGGGREGSKSRSRRGGTSGQYILAASSNHSENEKNIYIYRGNVHILYTAPIFESLPLLLSFSFCFSLSLYNFNH